MSDARKADVLVDLDLCKACGICVALCPAHVFDADAGGQAVAARPKDCTVCRLCEWHCPDFAIEVVALVTKDAGEADVDDTDADATGEAAAVVDEASRREA